jgi:hypothetical protein
MASSPFPVCILSTPFQPNLLNFALSSVINGSEWRDHLADLLLFPVCLRSMRSDQQINLISAPRFCLEQCHQWEWLNHLTGLISFPVCLISMHSDQPINLICEPRFCPEYQNQQVGQMFLAGLILFSVCSCSVRSDQPNLRTLFLP